MDRSNSKTPYWPNSELLKGLQKVLENTRCVEIDEDVKKRIEECVEVEKLFAKWQSSESKLPTDKEVQFVQKHEEDCYIGIHRLNPPTLLVVEIPYYPKRAHPGPSHVSGKKPKPRLKKRKKTS